MRKFWNCVNEYLVEIRRGSRIVLIGDKNGSGNKENNRCGWKRQKESKDGVNKNVEYLVDTCSGSEPFFPANTFFQHKIIYKGIDFICTTFLGR